MLISLTLFFQFGTDPNLKQLNYTHEISGFHQPQAMVLVDDELWVLDAQALYRVDWKEMSCQMEMALPQMPNYEFLAFGGGFFWVADRESIWKLNPQSLAFTFVCAVEVVDAIFFDQEKLWIAQGQFQRMIAILPSGEVVDQRFLPKVESLASFHLFETQTWFVDVGSHTLSHFDGTWSREGDWGPHPGFWDRPTSIDRDKKGRLLVCDQNNQRLAVWDAEWRYFGGHERYAQEGLGKLHYPKQALFLNDSAIAVLEPMEDRIQIVKPGDEFQMRFSSGKPHFGPYMSLAGQRLAIADPIHFQILILDLRHQIPVLIHQLGYRGKGSGQFTQFADLELDGENTLWALDEMRKQKFFLEPLDQLRFAPRLSKFVTSVPRSWTHFAGGANGWAVGKGGSLVKLQDWQEVEVLNIAGGWGHITDLEIDQQGNLWVLDQLLRCVVIFNPEGQRLRTIELSLQEPFGLGLARDQFCISDQFTHTLNWYRKDGAFVMQRGGWGQEPTEMVYPADVDWSEQGRWFVVDSGNHRLIGYRPDGQWDVVFTGARSLTPETYVRPK